MDAFESYSSQTLHLRTLERNFIEALASPHCPLLERESEAVRHGFALARIQLVRTQTGDVDAFMAIAPFRHWLVEQLEYCAHHAKPFAVDWRALRRLIPSLLARLGDTRARVLAQHPTLPPARLDREVERRVLVVALGGGGGAGYPHLGALEFLERLGVQPAGITGSSMGAMLGLVRAAQTNWDRDAALSVLPGPNDVGTVFSPYRGFSRFCFPGAVEIRARTFGEAMFFRLFGRPIPRLSELPIKYYPVVTGLRTGIGLAISEVEDEIARITRAGRLARLQRNGMLLAQVVRLMVANPRFLVEIPFGLEPGLRDFDAIDAMGFSCAVPGVLHYDIFTHRQGSIDPLRDVFARHQLFRLTDGGVVNNVPSRVAARAVWEGDFTLRNAFVLSFDGFAPQLNQNAVFAPIQQFVRSNVLANRPWSDLQITYRNPPSPLSVLQSRQSNERVIQKTLVELERYAPQIRLAMRPLPRLETLRDAFALAGANP